MLPSGFVLDCRTATSTPAPSVASVTSRHSTALTSERRIPAMKSNPAIEHDGDGRTWDPKERGDHTAQLRQPDRRRGGLGWGSAMRSLTDLAGDLSVPTEQLLTTLRIVASRAGVDELADWAARELEGYGEGDELPAHRRWHLTIVASLHNPMQGFVRDTHVGDFAIAKQYREKATVHYCRGGVGQER